MSETSEHINKSELDLDLNKSEEIEFTLDQEDAYIPDGGAKAWINLAGVFCGLTGCMGIVNSNGAVQEYISHNVLPNEAQSTIGWIFSVFNFSCFGMLLFVGPIFESYGSRICLLIGIGIFALGYMSLASSTKLYQFVLSNIAGGLGMSFVFGSSVGIISHYFQKRRSSCLGLVFSGGAIGGIVFPIVMRSLFPKIGFLWTLRVLGFIILTLFAIELALTKDRRKEINPAGADQDSFMKKTIGRIHLGAFKEKVFSALVVSLMCSSFTFLITLTYLISYSVAVGYSYHDSTNLTIVLNATSILGRTCGGYLADRYGRFNVLVLVNTCCSLCFLILWIPQPISHTFGGLVAFSALYGMSLGSNIPLGPATVGQISKTSEFTSRYGTSSVLVSLLNLAGVPVGGAIIGDNLNMKGYDNMVIFVTCLSLVGWTAGFTARYLLVGFSWRKV